VPVVPVIVYMSLALDPGKSLPSPKSASLTRPSSAMRMFDGFTSRWMIAGRWPWR